MKRILCIMLSALLLCNTTVVYADDLHGGSSGSIDVTPTITIPSPAIDPHALDELIFRLVRPDIAGAVDSLQTWWDKWIGDRWKTDADREKDYSISSGGSTVHLHKQFVDELNQAVQDKVHALDGYYLVEPDYPYDLDAIKKYIKETDKHNKDIDKFSKEDYDSFKNRFDSSDILVVGKESPWGQRYCFSTLDGLYLTFRPKLNKLVYFYNLKTKDYNNSLGPFQLWRYNELYGYSGQYGSCNFTLDLLKDGSHVFFYNSPIKVFYSEADLMNYLNNGKVRIYAPQLPSTTISIPVKYINNSVSLPDITYNINTTNKTEVEIQNEYNTTLNNYLNDLNNFTDGSEVTPTPTPDGGFTDGTTPTPKPDFGDDSNPTDTNDWLKKIYEWLQSFGDTHSKFEKTITDYIEANDGKLDQIIEAINALSGGKTEDEKNGCKYDFTALSDFMTKLWNESDKKFDKMVELLEENNKYQKKLVNSLNEIKAILVTQTIMDVFQDRSQQTAEKAKDKFPTSLPWDIALVVNAMSAEPEKPQFNLPIQIKSLNINEEIHVDLASGEWEKLAKTCRYLLSILFILFMIQLSRKLFSNGGDD